MRIGPARIGKRAFLGNSGMAGPGHRVPRDGLVAVLSVAPREVEGRVVVARLAGRAPAPRRERRRPRAAPTGPRRAPPGRPHPVGAVPARPRRRHLRHRARRAPHARRAQSSSRVRSSRRCCRGVRDARRREPSPRRSPPLAKWAFVGRDPRRRASALVVASSGAPRWPTPSSRWSPRPGSRTPPPARRRSACGCASLGAKIGRGVWTDSYWLPEADLVTLGDGATVNRGCVVQTHLFHDRIMSIDTVTLGRGCDPRPAQRHPARCDASAPTRRWARRRS